MAQYFRPSSNTLSRASIAGGLLGLCALAGGLTTYNFSPYVTQKYVPIEQPVPFSHQHHVGQLGLDCRYCHVGVEESHFAGVPPTHTCMTCHSQVWNDSPTLAPVRASLIDDRPLRWQRVHVLPQFVYFRHDIHINKGVACETCHGRVDKMPITWKVQHMTMSWCVNCHRDPAPYLRPRDAVFTMGWTPDGSASTRGAQLMREYNIKGRRALTDCTTCHR